MKGYRILVADDDINILELVELYLKKEGFEVIRAVDGRETLELMEGSSPHLLILDIMMPLLDGWEVCREMRRRGFATPIILLTARGEDYDKILGLELGADDYVTKPFNPRELVARVKAVLRRLAVVNQASRKISYPGLEVDLESYLVMVDGKAVDMTRREVELLWYLASQPNRVFTREQLLENVWGYSYCGDTRTVDTHIKRLRKKMSRTGEDEKPPCWEIKTVWGVGYKLELHA